MQEQSHQTKETFSVHAIIQKLKAENSELHSKMTDSKLRSCVKQQLLESSPDRRVFHFEDLRNAMVEFGVQIHRPPFLEDGQAARYTVPMNMVGTVGNNKNQINEDPNQNKQVEED